MKTYSVELNPHHNLDYRFKINSEKRKKKEITLNEVISSIKQTEKEIFYWQNEIDLLNMVITYRLVIELTLVLLRDRRDIIESPQLTTVPLLIENVRRRYKSSLWRGLYGRSGNEQTLGRWWSGTENKIK